MMSRRMYLLITRSSFLLIVFLLAAPVVDHWRFGRFAPAGRGSLPIGAILPGERDEAAEPAGEPAADRAPTSGSAGSAPARVVPAAFVAPTRAAAATGRAAAPASTRATAVPDYLAWTAYGQIDPFWDGVVRPAAKSAAGEPVATPSDAASPGNADGAGGEPSNPPDALRPGDATLRTKSARGVSLRRAAGPTVELPEGDDPSVEAGARQAPDESADPAPPVDGWIVGQPSATPKGADSGRAAPDPAPLPPSTTGGGTAPSRNLTPEPRPRPIAFPTAFLEAPSTSVGVGESFDVVVRVDSVEEMTSLPFHLTFDAGILSFVRADAGAALAALQPVLLASVNPNRPGDLAVGLSLIESSGVFSGTGALIVLRFQAVASGRSDLTFDRATLRGAASEPVETRFTGATIVVR